MSGKLILSHLSVFEMNKHIYKSKGSGSTPVSAWPKGLVQATMSVTFVHFASSMDPHHGSTVTDSELLV